MDCTPQNLTCFIRALIHRNMHPVGHWAACNSSEHVGLLQQEKILFNRGGLKAPDATWRSFHYECINDFSTTAAVLITYQILVKYVKCF